GFYSNLEDLKDRPLTEKGVKHANELLLELGRELILINFAKEGKFRHDPALDVPKLPDIAPVLELQSYKRDEHLYHVTLNHLLRGSNRISSTYRKLTKAIQRF